MLRMSEKFVEHQKKIPSVARTVVFGLLGGLVWGHALPERQNILKIMHPRLAKFAFHDISAVKIKFHLTIYLKHLINLAFFKKWMRIFLPDASERENVSNCVIWKVCSRFWEVYFARAVGFWQFLTKNVSYFIKE